MSLFPSTRIVVLALVTAFAMPLLAQSPAAADIPPGDEYGGTVRVAILGPIDLSPTATGPYDRIAHELVYDSLARRSSSSLLPEPWLASSWVVDEAGKKVTFSINPNAKWYDNTSITAADIIQNFLDYTVSSPSAGNVTFDFSTSGGGGRFLNTDIYRPIALRSGGSGYYYSGPFWANDTGTDHLTLAVNPYFWGRRPYLDSVRYDYYSNASNGACAYINRNATFIGFPLTGDDLTTENYGCGNKKILDVNDTLPQLFIAQNPGLTVVYMGMNDDKWPLTDDTLRLAITKTIDREGFPDKIKTYSEIADNFVNPLNAFWFNTSAPAYRVPRAIVDNRVTKIFDSINAELESAGYMDWNYDGWRETPSHQTFSLQLLRLTSETPAFKDTLKDDIRSIGVKVDDIAVDTYAEIMNRVQNDNFTLFLGTMQAGLDPSFLYNYFHGSGTSNYFDYDDSTLNDLLKNADDALNLTSRQKYVKSALSWMATDVPAAPILHLRSIDVYDKLTYEGWVNQLGGINNFWSFYNLHAIARGSMTVEVVAQTQEPNRINAGDSTTIQVTVTNESGAIEDADVEITAAVGTLANATGRTDSNGRYYTTFSAAMIDRVTPAPITARVTKTGHTEAYGQTAIAIHPLSGMLYVDVVRVPSPVTIKSNEEVTLIVQVSDLGTGLPVSGAAVNLTLIPDGAGAHLSVANGVTNASGRFQTVFSGDVGASLSFVVQVKVSKVGYASVTKPTGMVIEGHGGVLTAGGADVFAIVAVVILAVLIVVFFLLERRRRSKTSE